MQTDYKPDTGFEIEDNFCGRIMAILELKLVKVNTADEEATAENVN